MVSRPPGAAQTPKNRRLPAGKKVLVLHHGRKKRPGPGPASDQNGFSGTPGSFERTPWSFKRTPGSFKRTPGSFKRPPGSFKRTPHGRKKVLVRGRPLTKMAFRGRGALNKIFQNAFKRALKNLPGGLPPPRNPPGSGGVPASPDPPGFGVCRAQTPCKTPLRRRILGGEPPGWSSRCHMEDGLFCWGDTILPLSVAAVWRSFYI